MAAAADPATSSTFRFMIPDDVRTFAPFGRLPTEIRHNIWEEAVRVPGMHFLRLQTSAPRPPPPPPPAAGLAQQSDDSDSDSEDGGNGTSTTSSDETDSDGDDATGSRPFRDEHLPDVVYPAELAPLYPTPRADLSFYVALNSMLTRLTVTCPDADRAVQHLLRRPDVVRLAGTGRVISLDGAADVICLDYLPSDMFESGCRMPMDIECPDLDRVRRVAVRYCHKWEEKTRTAVCERCHRIHDVSSQKVYPVHLFQFLARYLPNLETFYFIDYLILRKAGDDGLPKPLSPTPCFRSGGGRTYYEASCKDWSIRSKVCETMSWLGRNFRHYATTSKLNRHPRPGAVRFKVLACEWAPGQELGLQNVAAAGWKRTTKKRAAQEDEASSRRGLSPRSRSSAMFAARTPASPSLPALTPAVRVSRVDDGQYVFGEDREFEFTFRV